jgi:hypothetical protein
LTDIENRVDHPEPHGKWFDLTGALVPGESNTKVELTRLVRVAHCFGAA